MSQHGMLVSTDFLVFSSNVMPRKKAMNYKPGIWEILLTNVNQFSQDDFNQEQLEGAGMLHPDAYALADDLP